jgi:hypothetical protein
MMEPRKPDEAGRSDAPDGASRDDVASTDPRERRRTRAREAGLQSLVRSLATRPPAAPER